MRAKDAMIADPVVVAAGATVAEVASLMRARNISVVPVINDPKERHYQGTLSDRDIVVRCIAEGHDPTECQAAEHVRTDTPVVNPDTELKGYKLPREVDPLDHHVRATIVVVDASKKVVGFIPHPEEVAGIVLT